MKQHFVSFPVGEGFLSVREVRVGSFLSPGHSRVTHSEEEEPVKINFTEKCARLILGVHVFRIQNVK